MKRYCGRDFSLQELLNISDLIKNNSSFNRTKLSQEICRMLGWYKADGGLKEMSCRVAMLRMQKDALISLPPSLRGQKTIFKPLPSSRTEPQELIQQPVHQMDALQLRLVTSKDTSLWNEYIERYHYLGYTNLPGAQLRYFVSMNEKILALLGFGASAW